MIKKDYSYLWYPLTNLVEVDNDRIKFKISSIISPYIELNLENLTKLSLELKSEFSNNEKIEIEINPFLRFPELFYFLNNPDLRKSKTKLKENLSNLIFHFLGNIDLYLGQNRKDIIVKEIIKDIENNCFGEKSKNLFVLFKEYEKYMVADIICSMYEQLGMIDSFRKVVKLVFKDSIIYDRLSSDTNLVLYLNYPKSKRNLGKVEFIKEIFLPLGLKLDIFWENHFGVIDVDITMKVGEIAVF